MSDLNSRQRALNVIRKIHPEYGPLSKKNTERPDIQFRDDDVGIEVTCAYSEQEGRFYANARNKIRNPEKLFNNVLSIGYICLMEDTDNIIRRVSNSISKKAAMAVGYRIENPWMKRLGLAIIIGYDLELHDLELAISNLSQANNNTFDELYLLMPSKSFYFDGRNYLRVK